MGTNALHIVAYLFVARGGDINEEDGIGVGAGLGRLSSTEECRGRYVHVHVCE